MRSKKTGYNHNEHVARKKRELSESIRNIGAIPVILNIERRLKCERSFLDFILEYSTDDLDPFSEDHVRVIHRFENIVFHGGRFVEAVFRGFGKSTLARIGAAWIILYGHKLFLPVFGANSEMAEANLDAIKNILQSEKIAQDFPEVSFPIQKIEGIAQRAGTQLYTDKDGNIELTHMEWGKKEIRLPWTDGSFDEHGNFHENKARGSIVLSCGILSKKVRGANRQRHDGISLRPDFVIIDDPQDDESAESPGQITKRLNVIRKGIIRSASHTKGMSLIMPCTVVCKNDVVDQLLDHKKNPAWQGERVKFVRKWAEKHNDMWLEKYKELRTTYDPTDPDDYLRARNEATEYYRQNREEMDKGAEIAWEYCYEKDNDEISAIQHAYNALIDDGEEAFASEFQNEPYEPPEEEGQLTTDVVFQRVQDNLVRGEVPDTCHILTSFIDVQKNVLFWAVVAWEPWFTGYIVDYGCYPQQNSVNFTLREIKSTLFKKFPGMGQEGVWRAGLEHLSEIILTRDYIKQDGSAIRVSRLMIDANDGNAAQTIFDFCRASTHRQLILPARGRAVTASGIPFSEYKRKRGDRVSPYNWRIPSPAGKAGSARYIYSDVNYWKSFVRSRFFTATGDRGCLLLFGKEKNGYRANHTMFAEHATSQYSVRTSGRGRTVDEWSTRPNREDHYWDCLVGCAIAASEQGIVLGETDYDKVTRQRTRSHKERLASLGKVIG